MLGMWSTSLRLYFAPKHEQPVELFGKKNFLIPLFIDVMNSISMQLDSTIDQMCP